MNVNLCRSILELYRLPSLKNQALSHSVSAICTIKQEYIPGCTASPSALNVNAKCQPGLAPTWSNAQLIKGEGRKECHFTEQRLFQTITL